MARVLLVEDEEVLRCSLTGHLEFHGHVVVAARNGTEALEAARDFVPDVVVTDWLLRNHLHGLDVCQALRARYPALPTILITGFPDLGIREAAREASIDAFLEKPFSIDALLAAMNETTTESTIPASRRFVFRCRHCQATVIETERVQESESQQLRDHLEQSHTGRFLTGTATGPLLSHFDVLER